MTQAVTFHSAEVARAADRKIVLALFDGPGISVGLFACSDDAALNLAAKILAVLAGDGNTGDASI